MRRKGEKFKPKLSDGYARCYNLLQLMFVAVIDNVLNSCLSYRQQRIVLFEDSQEPLSKQCKLYVYNYTHTHTYIKQISKKWLKNIT